MAFSYWTDVMAPLTNQAPVCDQLDQCLANKLHRLSLATFDDEGNMVEPAASDRIYSNNR